MKYLLIICLFFLGCTKEEEIPVSEASVTDICHEIVVRPNPVQDILSIQFNGTHRSVSLKILDSYGKILFEGIYNSIEDGKVNIDLSGQPEGLYFVQVVTDIGECTIKLVKN